MKVKGVASVAGSAGDRFRETARVTLVGAAVNLVLAVIKILVGVVGHSEALIADGVHSLSDLLSDGLVYYAARHSRNKPDDRHPYGHGRFETVATMGLGGLLILVGGGIVWDAVERMLAPERLMAPAVVVLVVAGVSVASKEVLYHYTLRTGRRLRSEMLKANAWHHRSDAVSSIVVFVGVLGTLAGLNYLDAVAAVLVGVMVGKIGWDLSRGAAAELVDVGLDPEQVAEIRNQILSIGGVRDTHMLRTRRLGGVAAADVHVLVDPHISVSEGHMISLMVERRLKHNVDEVEDVTVHIDPEDDSVAPSCVGLPLRAEVLERLARHWTEIPGADQRERITLHYLSGKIEVDVFFPLRQAGGPAQSAALRENLQSSLEADPRFGRVKVLFV